MKTMIISNITQTGCQISRHSRIIPNGILTFSFFLVWILLANPLSATNPVPVTSDNESLDGSQSENPSVTTHRSFASGGLPEGHVTALEVMQLEHRVGDVLTRALNNHFESSRYLLDVTIDLTSSTVLQEIPIPLIREFPNRLEEELPGLPHIPEDMVRELGSTYEPEHGVFLAQKVRIPEIERFRIVLHADSLFDESDLDLMRQIIRSKIRLDTERGDTFELVQQRIGTEPDPERETLYSLINSDRFIYLSLAIILLLGIFMSLILWYLTVFLPRQQQQETAALVSSLGSSRLSDKEKEELKMNSKSESREQQPHTSPQDYLMQIILNNPEQIGRLFTYWHVREGDRGLERAALILLKTDPKLMGLLQPTMPKESYNKLGKMVISPNALDKPVDHEFLSQFADELRAREYQTGGREGFPIMSTFDFLNYIDDERLMDILKSETDPVKALVLSHLSSNRKSRVLQEFGLEEAGKILYCMSQIRNIPYQEYEKIATRLFDNSFRANTDDKNHSEKNIDQIVSIIESVPPSNQEKYIRQLEGIASELAAHVRRRIITMERIPEIEVSVLEETVETMSRRDLAAALVGTDEILKSRLLQFRPRNEENQIRQQIHELEDLSRDAIDEARRKLLNNIRDIRNRKGLNRSRIGPMMKQSS